MGPTRRVERRVLVAKLLAGIENACVKRPISAEAIAREALSIAAEICIYTNAEIKVVTLP